jgi:hypothetical protein
MSCANKRIAPTVGRSSPAIIRIVVPDPLGLMIEKDSPSIMRNETASTATEVPKSRDHERTQQRRQSRHRSPRDPPASSPRRSPEPESSLLSADTGPRLYSAGVFTM